ncbi:MAG TPA: hypothetical protein VL175_21665 [Pirellulales bacterium]|jgi:hypothetical protein|nr:hypothetical protein [Pirellulales bacterium]
MLKILTIVAAALALVIANTDRSLARGGGGRAGGRPGNGGFRDSGSRGEGEHGELRSEEGLRGEAGRNAIGDRNVGQTLSARNFQNAGHFTQKVSQSTMANRAQNVRNNFNRDTFNRNWWNRHPGAWFAAGWAAGGAWNAATWPALAGWYGWGTAAPVTYDYGGNVAYDDGEVYYGDSAVASADDYYSQASGIAESNPPAGGPQDNWLPLGVFGLVQGDQTSPSAVFQLATNKQGAIQGNFCDVLSGSTLTVHGAVEPKSQRAAWTVGDNTDTVYETGLANLTKNECGILVHFGKDRTQQYMLVRLKQPQEQASRDTLDR